MKSKQLVSGGVLIVVSLGGWSSLLAQNEPAASVPSAEAAYYQDSAKKDDEIQGGVVGAQDEVFLFEMQARQALQLQQQIQQLGVTMNSLSRQLENLEKLQNQVLGNRPPSKDKLHEVSELFGRTLKGYLVEAETAAKLAARQDRSRSAAEENAARMRMMEEFMKNHGRNQGVAVAGQARVQEKQAAGQVQDSEQRMRLMQQFYGQQRQVSLAELEQKAKEVQSAQNAANELFQRALMGGKPLSVDRFEKMESRLDRIEALLERLVMEKFGEKSSDNR